MLGVPQMDDLKKIFSWKFLLGLVIVWMHIVVGALAVWWVWGLVMPQVFPGFPMWVTTPEYKDVLGLMILRRVITLANTPL